MLSSLIFLAMADMQADVQEVIDEDGKGGLRPLLQDLSPALSNILETKLGEISREGFSR